VYRNGVKLGSADFTATNGTSVVLANACAAGDYVRFEGFLITTFNNAIANTNGAVGDSLIASVSASKLTGSRTLPNSTLPAGTIIQTVNATSNTQYSTTSSSLSGTVSLSITPQYANSKILVNWMIAGGVNGGNNVGAHWALYRGASLLADYAYVLYNSSSSAGQMLNPVPIIYVDSPNTTSSVTYQLYIGTSGTTTATINNYYSSVLVLQEIAV